MVRPCGVVMVVASRCGLSATFTCVPLLRPERLPPRRRWLSPCPTSLPSPCFPLYNMSEDPKQDYFSDGITEEIITALSKSPKLFVIARNSTFTYKGKPVKVKQVS